MFRSANIKYAYRKGWGQHFDFVVLIKWFDKYDWLCCHRNTLATRIIFHALITRATYSAYQTPDARTINKLIRSVDQNQRYKIINVQIILYLFVHFDSLLPRTDYSRSAIVILTAYLYCWTLRGLRHDLILIHHCQFSVRALRTCYHEENEISRGARGRFAPPPTSGRTCDSRISAWRYVAVGTIKGNGSVTPGTCTIAGDSSPRYANTITRLVCSRCTTVATENARN